MTNPQNTIDALIMAGPAARLECADGRIDFEGGGIILVDPDGMRWLIEPCDSGVSIRNGLVSESYTNLADAIGAIKGTHYAEPAAPSLRSTWDRVLFALVSILLAALPLALV